MLPIPQRHRASQPPHEGRGLRGAHNPQGAPKTSWMGLEPSLCQSPAGLVILVEGACSWSGVGKVGPFLSPDSTTSHLHLKTNFFLFFFFCFSSTLLEGERGPGAWGVLHPQPLSSSLLQGGGCGSISLALGGMWWRKMGPAPIPRRGA